MRQEQIRERLLEAMIDKEYFGDIFSIINQHVAEVIGEDEMPDEYTPRALTESELSLAHQAVQFQARNKVRAEQRKRAGL